MKYCLIATEGPHDQAVLNKIFRELNYTEFNGAIDSLEPYWQLFIPKYPASNNLYKRLSFPTILRSDTHSIAIHLGEGANLKNKLAQLFSARADLRRSLHAVGIVVDCDNNQPNQIAIDWHNQLKGVYANFPNTANTISGTKPKLGIYVLPDNVSQGVLDKIMCACAQHEYQPIWDAAKKFVNAMKPAQTNHWGPFDEYKALCAAVTSILKPGSTNTVSYKADRWVSNATFNAVDDLGRLKTFVQDLIA